jgi:hypothetical protein
MVEGNPPRGMADEGRVPNTRFWRNTPPVRRPLGLVANLEG